MNTTEKALASSVSSERLKQLHRYWQASNYLGAAQLYLKDNVLLERALKASDIKPRLLGHWGTVPGFDIYASEPPDS